MDLRTRTAFAAVHVHGTTNIGLDGIVGSAATATDEPRDWTDGELGAVPRATFADLAQVGHHRPVVALDVHRPSEWRAGHTSRCTS